MQRPLQTNPQNTKTSKDIIATIYNYPPGSVERADLQEELSRAFLQEDQEKFSKYLLTFESFQFPHDQGYPRPIEVRWHILNYNDGAITVSKVPSYTTEGIPLFNERLSFTEDPTFKFLKRADVEYNSCFKQVIVAAYITDGSNIVLLQATNVQGDERMIGKMTMVQGHVEFSTDAYQLSQVDYLRDSMIRELNEEIITDDIPLQNYLPLTPKYMVGTNDSLISMEHVGIIYEIQVGNVDAFLAQASSGEPDKHSLVKVPIGAIAQSNPDPRLDGWVKVILADLWNSK